MSAAGKSEIGLCGVVGGMMVIELLAGKMRLVRGGIAAEMNVRQTYTVKHIRKGLTLLNLCHSYCVRGVWYAKTSLAELS